MQACCDVAGALPAAATRANRGSCDLLEGQLFAYGAGTMVVVVEVGRAGGEGQLPPPCQRGHGGKPDGHGRAVQLAAPAQRMLLCMPGP